jgi:hypothetical protein
LDLDKAKNILSSFYPPETLPKNTQEWTATKPLPLLLARYAVAQLENQECVETINFIEYEPK